jgi:hypothetical protein
MACKRRQDGDRYVYVVVAAGRGLALKKSLSLGAT